KFRQPFNSISFPPALKYLSFYFIEKPIRDYDLPNGITHLLFKTINYGRIYSLPESVHHLDFSHQGKKLTKVPPQIKHLKVNRVWDNIDVPTTVKSVTTNRPSGFNKKKKEQLAPPDPRLNKVIFSPNMNIHLHGIFFNLFIKPYTLLNNIKSITFGDDYSQVILKGAIPNSVEYLDFGPRFNQRLCKSVLPKSLKVLKLGYHFNQELNGVFPSSLVELVLDMNCKPILKNEFFVGLPNLKKLLCPYYDGLLDILPNSINDLSFAEEFDWDWGDDFISFPIESVPPTITRLKLNQEMSIQSYQLIPSTIKSIALFNTVIEKNTKLPVTIESVEFPNSFNDPLESVFQYE
ncbi:hypothetical protein CYY_010557, partial [Polysphondylium violaceum]